MSLQTNEADARPDRDLLSLLSEAITSDLDLRRLLQTVTDIGTDLSGAEFGAFFYNARDDSGNVYLLHVLSGAGLETFAAMPKPRITELFEPTFSGTATVRIADVAKDPRFSGMPPGHLPVRSYLAVPVVTRTDEVIGALLFGHRDPDRFDEECERTLHVVAAQAAVAVENARLFAAEQAARQHAEQATARLALLHTLAGRLSAALTVEDTVSAVTDVLTGPIAADRVGVFLRHGDGYRNMHTAAQPDERASSPLMTFLPDSEPNPVLAAITSGAPYLQIDRAALLADFPQLSMALDRLAELGVIIPLSAGDQLIGACTFAWDVEREMSPDDLEMLCAATSQVGSAIDRARLFEAERDARDDLARSIRAATETSRALQRALLPRSLPAVEGMTIAVRYQASDLDAEVGGDWYDVVPREHGALLVLGDVQGHNLSAAALMGQLRTGLHAYLAEGHSIEHAVARANHLMTQLTEDMMATCCLVDVDLAARELRMVCAGHPGAICLTGGEDLLVLPERTGLPLGVVPDSVWPVTTAPLGDDDRLVLYTDGLVERRGADIYSGMDHLRSLSAGLAGRSAEDAARVLVSEMGADAEDDLALLVCDLQPQGTRTEARTFRIAATTDDVSVIRRQARNTMSAWNLTPLVYTGALVISELTTNILRHTRTVGSLQLQRLPDGVRITATDDDDRLPALDLAPDRDASSGRGLLLVKSVADAWGVQLNSHGKTIWVELRTAQDNLIPSTATVAAG